MTRITREQAEKLLENTTEGPWVPSKSGYVGSASGVMIHDGQVLGDTEADTALIAAAPDLAETVIAQAYEIEQLKERPDSMTEEWAIEVLEDGIWDPDTAWQKSRESAESLAPKCAEWGPVRLVRRLATQAEAVDE